VIKSSSPPVAMYFPSGDQQTYTIINKNKFGIFAFEKNLHKEDHRNNFSYKQLIPFFHN
jgi:hypothetical protein